MEYKPLPIGVDNFEKMITTGYYFIDKTDFIKELMDKKGDVNLFTRPRRFGKTLNLSMLQYFFEDRHDKKGVKEDYSELFEGLNIMDAGERYTSHMGQYPVINLTLKAGKQPDFETAYKLICRQIAGEYERHQYLLDGEMSPKNKKKFQQIMEEDADRDLYVDSLYFLSKCLYEHFDKKTILLIDEYDVPLENAHMRGFYQEMADFIRSLFESVLKTNNSLEFAVLTGCLRISKESIFTGLNNLDINSILNNSYGEAFGFLESEVRKLCTDYGMPEKYQEIKAWYNGYMFGKSNVYNPWSSIKYIKDHLEDRDAFPEPYWANTSSNAIVRTLIDRADRKVKDEIEKLIAGGVIEKPVHEDITYDEIYNAMDNLWNFMFFTGYFKKAGERFENRVQYLTLKIPNQEVLYIFENKIRGWFEERLKARDRQKFLSAVVSRDVQAMKNEIRGMLYDTISFMDYYESFYHGFLAGILYGIDYYTVKSNRESGNGRTDLYLQPAFCDMPVYIFEFKCAKKGSEMEAKADEALRQIEEKKYEQEFWDMGYTEIVKYGICFFGKDCLVKKGEKIGRKI